MKKNPPSPPAKPMRVAQFVSNESRRSVGNLLEPELSNYMPQIQNQQNTLQNNRIYENDNQYDDVVLRNHPSNYNHFKSSDNIVKYSQNALQKPKYTDVWVQQYQQHQLYFDQQQPPQLNHGNNLIKQPKVYNNKHWLLQEAEQRRLDQHRTINFNRHSMSDAIIQSSSPDLVQKPNNTPAGSSVASNNSNINNKPLPDSVIQTLTQRVHSRGIGERMTLPNAQKLASNVNSDIMSKQKENILSVSGKKKCSHCKEELGDLIFKKQLQTGLNFLIC